ncbi:MAG: selenocysteine-specific translation elongation factor, partial [Anaerolineaceae bacterium]|nr:selenocysteine-specific translation elongation factor [Anaerolineaceae bacterium]
INPVQVIGTAGHVDHGKSTLINRLTGINPDRLKAEQDREMSIELGFAWFELPNGEDIGIVDVPGHRDFIENMLAGIGGIDAALFVVAADEGVMPQTREHLAILDLLQIPAAVVALTKIDLVQDAEWLDLVEADLQDTLKGTALENAPIVRVSARSGEGLDALVQTLQDVLAAHPHRPDLGRPRLPVDRVFTLPGFGTIVTGTLTDGHLSVGDAVEILPPGIEGRIRGLQTHKQAEEKAQPGSRTAVNISGVSVDEIHRGDVVIHPGTYQSTTMIDVWVRLLKDASAPLKHNSEMKLFLGAAEVITRVRLLGTKELKPGEEGFLQLMLEHPVVALRQDRFILRRPSPAETIGGGQVVDPHPKRRHKRFNEARLEDLAQMMVGTPEEILMQSARQSGAISQAKLIEIAGLEPGQAQAAIEALLESGELTNLTGKKLLIPTDQLTQHQNDLLHTLANFHQQNPLQFRMPREQLRTENKLSADIFDAVVARLAASGEIVAENAFVRMAEHTVKLNEAQQAKVDSLLRDFIAKPYTPPSVKESQAAIGDDLVTVLIQTGQLAQLGEDVLLQPTVLQEMQDAVIEIIQQNGSVALAELRDRFQTSRKYAVAVLEDLDARGITVRKGDGRVLRKKA